MSSRQMPALANLFACYDPDEAVIADLGRTMRQSGDFDVVHSPAPGWVVGVTPLPSSPPAPKEMTDACLFFAEGAEVVTDAGSKIAELLNEVLDLVRSAPEKLAVLPGDFGFIHVRDRGAITVVRSCAGLVPFYLRRQSGRLAVGTRLGYFVKFLPGEHRLDPLVNASWTTSYTPFPYERTFVEGVSILSAGHFWAVEDGRVQRGAYWKPVPDRLKIPSQSQRKERAERLRDLLVRKLDKDLDPEGENLLSLSGGVDSTAMGALAAVHHKVSSISIVPPEGPLLERELSYINPLAAEAGLFRMWFEHHHSTWYVDLLQRPPTVLFQVAHPILLLVPQLLKEAPIKVLFGGEFADEVCGSGLSTPDWALATSPARLLKAIARRTLPYGRRSTPIWVKHRGLEVFRRPPVRIGLELPGWIRKEVHEEFNDWLSEQRKWALQHRSPRRNLAFRVQQGGFVPMHWEATSPLGVRKSFPFFHREVLELAFSAHPDELVGPGTKKLLKLALQGYVPDRNLHRTDKGQWGTGPVPNVPWRQQLPDELASIVRSDWLPNPPSELPGLPARNLSQLLQVSRSLIQARGGT